MWQFIDFLCAHACVNMRVCTMRLCVRMPVCVIKCVQTFCTCTHVWKAIFSWCDSMHIKCWVLISESCHYISASNERCWKLLLRWHSRRIGEIRPPLEPWDNHMPWKWQAGLTDWKKHVSNMAPYASYTLEKLAVERAASWGSFHPAGICLTFKEKPESLPLMLYL